jgi:prepilin-type N-terminal cleavage/methylation domain-containing protein
MPGGGAHSLALLPSTNTYEGAHVRAKDTAQAYAPGGFLYPDSSAGKKNVAGAVATGAPYRGAPPTGDAGSNTLRTRRLGSANAPATSQQGTSACGTHRTPPVRGALQGRSGFTLVELIVVIVILGILLAIAIPALTGYINKADDTRIKHFQDIAHKAIQTWASERYADGLVGNNALVKPKPSSTAEDIALGRSIPVPSYSPSVSSYKATTWLEIVKEYAELDLDPSKWEITKVQFDNTNTLNSLTLTNTSSGQEAILGSMGESFTFTATTHTDGYIYIPTSGYTPQGTTNAAYDWLVSVDEGTPVRLTGTGSLYGAIVVAAGLGIHTVKIQEADVTEKEKNTYGWFRAFGFAVGDSVRLNIRELISPLPERGLNVAENDAGDYYGYRMFIFMNNVTMGPNFTIPQSITKVGDYFCANMFSDIDSTSFAMGAKFNLPQKIQGVVGDSFCQGLFLNMRSDAFNMNSAFNLPQGITGVGNNFCNQMFNQGSLAGGASFTMNGVFNLPPNITSIGTFFSYGMFANCSGAPFNMNSVFNIPLKITTIDNYFCSWMFVNCVGSSFTMNSVFNIPQGITTGQQELCIGMFQSSGSAFTVNDVFKLPKLASGQIDVTTDVFRFIFSDGTKAQTRSAESIINGNEMPGSPRGTFDDKWPDYATLDSAGSNWVKVPL